MEAKNNSRKTAAESRKAVRELTLLKAIGKVVKVSKESGLSEKSMNDMEKELKYLSERFGLSEIQALLFCVCMEKGPKHIEFSDFASHLEISKIQALEFAEDIDALIRRRLLRYHNVNDEDQIEIPNSVIKSLKHNEVYEMPERRGLDSFSLFDVLNELFEDLEDETITPQALYVEVKMIFKDNPRIPFVQRMERIDFDDWRNFLLLLYFCHQLVNNDDDDIHFSQIENLYESASTFNREKSQLRSGTHQLMTDGYIEHLCEEGIASTTRYKLTEHTKQTLLAELKLNTTEEKVSDVLSAGDLVQKTMFYGCKVQKQVEELQSFLAPEKYKEIRERMRKSGFRTGFACLFYGGPGTGKTETAYQLARETGRDIMVVDVPQIKSKWVGDSEKNIKALFDRYRELVRKETEKGGKAPILLFNEADGIIGIRKQGAQSAVDKMENSIQNIILQEMESLDGIMIATTNLTENLDTAFERRFLYKICFEKPDATVRKRLWMSMMSALSEADAGTLAEKYDFSGGQIENISRKATINVILHGEEGNSLEMLTEYCNAEKLNHHGQKRIGFC
jgi:ATP-dependent 26S proteasome regulatory subunit